MARWALIAGPKNSPKADHALALAQALDRAGIPSGGFIQVNRPDGDGGKVYELRRIGGPERVVLAAGQLAVPTAEQMSYCSLAFRREAFGETRQWVLDDAPGSKVLFLGEISKMEAADQGHAEAFRFALSLPDDVLVVAIIRSDQLFYVMERFALADVTAALELPCGPEDHARFYQELSEALGRHLVPPEGSPTPEHAPPGSLLWLDLEMSGLDPERERIIEIATVVTDRDLAVVAVGPNVVIHQPDELLQGMDRWNKKHHRRSGLTDAVRRSTLSEAEAEQRTLAFLDRVSPGTNLPLAGSSMWLDRVFLRRYMSRLHERIHYRSVDVTSVRELARRWAPKVHGRRPAKDGRHRALHDLWDSIAELRHYRSELFGAAPADGQSQHRDKG